ncbi:MAG TPA: hypothetical protein QGF58_08950 [Myxococcota bacterium]|nr:hypothetical protein [Myxococcota bacterium]
MKALDYSDISQFLSSVGRDSLFDYYGVRADAPSPVIEQALAERRRWAQAQQSNPKYRREAVWLIRHNAHLKQLLLQERERYIEEIEGDKEQANLEFLSLFIRGTMFSGTFTDEAEEAIRRQAASLAITDEVLEARIEQLLDENDAMRVDNGVRTPPPKIVIQAPPPRQPPAGPSSPGAAAMLASVIRDALSNGHIPSEELNRILADGQARQLTEADLLAQVQRAVAEFTTRVLGPPPKRPAQRPQPPVGARTVSGQRAQAPVRTTPVRERSDAIRDLVDTLRGAMLQGVLGEPTLRAMRSRGLSLGLEVDTVHALLDEARRRLGAYRDGREDPYQALGLGPHLPIRELQRAYRELRDWAWSHPDPQQCAQTSIRLDAAWCVIQEHSEA